MRKTVEVSILRDRIFARNSVCSKKEDEGER